MTAHVWPLRFRQFGDRFLFADDAGGMFLSDENFLHRYVSSRLTSDDLAFLLRGGHAYEQENDVHHTAFAWRWTQRLAFRSAPRYVMLIPTLRCNIMCRYCQVSRVDEETSGFDWNEQTLQQVKAFLASLPGDYLKVEFQGGEPMLRLDLLSEIRDFCRARFSASEFVVCTNLHDMDEAKWSFLVDPDTHVSTSLDGGHETHQRNRTKTRERTDELFSNLQDAVQRLSQGHVSALPTIDIKNPPPPAELFDSYVRHGLNSIYLRPMNYQGFARRLVSASDGVAEWNAWYSRFVDYIIERNWTGGLSVEEFYTTNTLRRLLSSGVDGHVNVRNPNLVASDYIVVDYDGKLYPSDEARMMSRVGLIDLSIGDVWTGIDQTAVGTMNEGAANNFDPDCIHCPFQPHCGTDVIDDISRYQRIDLPRHKTWFCQRQLAVFDKCIELMRRDDEPTRSSLAKWLGVPVWPRSILAEHA